jgi:hypothetical protein
MRSGILFLFACCSGLSYIEVLRGRASLNEHEMQEVMFREVLSGCSLGRSLKI